MDSPLTTPPQCEVIFRQDLRPGDTILALQSQRLLITLADNTPSELQPIVIIPQHHGPRSISHKDTIAAPVDRTAERTPPLEAMARRPSIVNLLAPPTDTKARAQAKTIGRTTREPEPEPEPKIQPRGDQIRRSRRQQTPRK